MPQRLLLFALIFSLTAALSGFTPHRTVAPAAVSAASGPDTTVVPAKVLELRRKALLSKLDPGIAIIPSARPRESWVHAQDSDFRQENNFYYLTGLETPDSWLVLFKGEGGQGKAMLYIPERNPGQEMWSGRQPGVGPETAELTGVEAVKPAKLFEEDILSRLSGGASFGQYERVYMPLGGDPSLTRPIIDLALDGRHMIIDIEPPLANLRQTKDSVELVRLRRAVDITAEAHVAAMREAQPGMHEFELEATIEYVFHSRGAQRVGFPSIVGSGPNSVILHHDRNRRRMEDGDLVVVDIGAEYGYYTADVTRTFPVNGKFSERQREIYELVLGTQKTVIDSVRPGVSIWELERIARRYMRNHSDGLCGDSTCDRYFVHGLSHWLGMNVHDVGDYMAPLSPGMVLTIEPGIYLAEEELGVRIEDDILVTEKGREVLSSRAPKGVEEIEALMGGGR
jgi:Xaa-Pro aminopeptidase